MVASLGMHRVQEELSAYAVLSDCFLGVYRNRNRVTAGSWVVNIENMANGIA